MKSLKELCSELVYKKCNFKYILNLKWLNCGMRCIPFKIYQIINNTHFWYCSCKVKKFIITNPNRPKFYYEVTSQANNCFYCWFLFMLENKIHLSYKHKNNLVKLSSLLIKFFEFINKYKYIYQFPNYQNMEFDYYETFNDYLDERLGCLCFNNYGCINFYNQQLLQCLQYAERTCLACTSNFSNFPLHTNFSATATAKKDSSIGNSLSYPKGITTITF